MPLSAFGAWARAALPAEAEAAGGLNAVQSRLFPAAYRGDDNLLVCAPTGAGRAPCSIRVVSESLSESYPSQYSSHASQYPSQFPISI